MVCPVLEGLLDFKDPRKLCFWCSVLAVSLPQPTRPIPVRASSVYFSWRVKTKAHGQTPTGCLCPWLQTVCGFPFFWRQTNMALPAKPSWAAESLPCRVAILRHIRMQAKVGERTQGSTRPCLLNPCPTPPTCGRIAHSSHKPHTSHETTPNSFGKPK